MPSLKLAPGLPTTIDAPGEIGALLAAQGLLLLIGRDVLQLCAPFCDGLAGEFTLSI
jgi:hypothetical protein